MENGASQVGGCRAKRGDHTIVNRSPDAFSAETVLISRCNFPAAPSPQNSTRWILLNLAAVGQTSAFFAHSSVCSPVAEDHLSLKVLNGSFTSTKSEPAGTLNFCL